MNTLSPHRLVEVPLRLDLAFAGSKPLVLPLDRYPCQPVVRGLALALLSRTNANGPIKRPWTAKAWRAAISRFTRWLGNQGFEGDLSDLTIDHLYEYGQQEKRIHEGRIRTLLLAAVPAAGVPRGITQELREHLEDGGLVSTDTHRNEPLEAYTPGEYNRLVAAGRATITEWERQLNPVPDAQVLLAFRVLIGLELGLPAESINALVLDDLVWTGQHQLHVRYDKERAEGAQGRSFKARGPWSGPMLVDRWTQATEPLRRTDESRKELWVYAAEEGDVVVPEFSDYTFRPHRLRFIREHQLRDDNGNPLSMDLRRLRTTWTARKSKYWHGAITVDPNHSAQVEGDRYLTRSADKNVMDSTVEVAQRDLLKRAETVVLIVSDEEDLADAVDDATLDPDLRQAKAPTDSWDMFAAFCRNPYESPFATTGTFCTAAVWTCIVCPLGIVTPSRLPALLRLQDYMQDQSAVLTHQEWLRVFGPAWVQLTTRIFPRFSDKALIRARQIVEEDLDLPIPPEPLEER